MMKPSLWSTCSTSMSSSNAITTLKDSYTGYTSAYIKGVVSGSVSKSLYFKYAINSPYSTAIRKIGSDGTLKWMAVFIVDPVQKGLAVDSSETYVLSVGSDYPLSTWRLSASTGAIIDVHSL